VADALSAVDTPDSIPDQKSPMPASYIANVILFLASDQAAMINGASILIDHGVRRFLIQLCL
jgi:hypothetical protein